MSAGESDESIAVAAPLADSAGEPVGLDGAKRWFAAALAKHRLGGTFLLVGPPGVGKQSFAKWVAKCLFCERTPADSLAACGACPACAQVQADTHPDLVQVRKPDDRAFIPLDLLIGPPDLRMQEGFCRDIRLRPFHGTRKVAILHDADYLNEEGANSLLKTFEEPPPDAVIFLLSANEQRQLPTIRSRSQIVRLSPPCGEEAVELFRCRGIEADAGEIERAIELCGGDCEAAASLLTEDGKGLRAELNKLLTRTPISAVELAQGMTAAVEDLGKTASAAAKRRRLCDLLSIAVQTFRGQMVERADSSESLPAVLYRLDRSIDAIAEVNRNANQATLIECWAADVSRGRPLA